MTYLEYREEENKKYLKSYFFPTVEELLERRLNRAFLIAEMVEKYKLTGGGR